MFHWLTCKHPSIIVCSSDLYAFWKVAKNLWTDRNAFVLTLAITELTNQFLDYAHQAGNMLLCFWNAIIEGHDLFVTVTFLQQKHIYLDIPFTATHLRNLIIKKIALIRRVASFIRPQWCSMPRCIFEFMDTYFFTTRSPRAFEFIYLES